MLSTTASLRGFVNGTSLPQDPENVQRLSSSFVG